MSARSRRRTSGFTLIELVAVIAILAVLAAYAAPRLIDNNSFSERGYADELASTLRLARSVAVATSCDVQVSINAGAYQVLTRVAAGGVNAPCAGAFVTPVRRADGNATLSGQPPASVNVPGNVTFTFSALTGSIAGGAPPAIAVGAFTLSVDADGWTQVR